MFVRNLCHTAGHAEIYAHGNDAKPKFFSGAIVNELRTYQLKTKYEVYEFLV